MITEREPLYGDSASSFRQVFYLKERATVAPELLLALADDLLDNLVLPGCEPLQLDMRRADRMARLSSGEFTPRRWKNAHKAIASGDCSLLSIEARSEHWPNNWIALLFDGNAPLTQEFRSHGYVRVSCSLPYLRHLAQSPAHVESLLQFGKRAWNGIDDVAYGFANVAWLPQMRAFNPADATTHVMPWDRREKPPTERSHPIPVAHMDMEGNLDSMYCADLGIKGAYWANYLSAVHIGMLGGAAHVWGELRSLRVESLERGGALIVATDSPIPEDTNENRRRFALLTRVLQPAFLSREHTTELKRPLLGYSYREAPLLP